MAGFLDLRDTEGKEHRFRHVHGPRSWDEGRGDISPLFALAKLTAEGIRIEMGKPINGGYTNLDLMSLTKLPVIGVARCGGAQRSGSFVRCT